MADQQLVYLEKKKDTGIYRCRGVLGEGDDFDSFAKKMLGNGLKAFITDTHQGREIQRSENDAGDITTTVLEV